MGEYSMPPYSAAADIDPIDPDESDDENENEREERLYNGERSKAEMRWVGIEPFLKSKGYLLPPRFQPDWQPSWQGPNGIPYEYAVDSFPLVVRVPSVSVEAVIFYHITTSIPMLSRERERRTTKGLSSNQLRYTLKRPRRRHF